MGVKNLWRLLLPVGHRLSIETLSHQTLAIDASIWLAQISKACRDPETGRMLPNRPHVRTFLLRLMRLLYHQIRPVVVFDGSMPEVKRREIQRRKDRREKLWREDEDGPGGSGGGGALRRTAKKILVKKLKEWREKESRPRKKERRDDGNSGGGEIESENSRAQPSNARALAPGFTLDDDDDSANATADEALDERKSYPKDKAPSNPKVTEIDRCLDTAVSIDSRDSPGQAGHRFQSQIGQFQRQTVEEEGIGNEDGLEGHYESDNDWEMSHGVQSSISESLHQRAEPPKSSPRSGGAGFYDDSEHCWQASDEAIASLPSEARSKWIESQRSARRIQSRKECIKAAANPDDYSSTQLRNFLKASELNKRVNEIVKLVENGGSNGGFVGGETQAGDRPLQHLRRHGNVHSDGDESENGFLRCEKDVAEDRPLMKVLSPSSSTMPVPTYVTQNQHTSESTYLTKMISENNNQKDWDQWDEIGDEESAEKKSTESHDTKDDGAANFFEEGICPDEKASSQNNVTIRVGNAHSSDDDDDDDNDVDWEDGASAGDQVQDDNYARDIATKIVSKQPSSGDPKDSCNTVLANPSNDGGSILAPSGASELDEDHLQYGWDQSHHKLNVDADEEEMPSDDGIGFKKIHASLANKDEEKLLKIDYLDGSQSKSQSKSTSNPLRPDRETSAALQRAQETASKLTNWAGRAFERAVSAHVGQQANTDSQGNMTPASTVKFQDTELEEEIDSSDSDGVIDAHAKNKMEAAPGLGQSKPVIYDDDDHGISQEDRGIHGKLNLFDTSLEGLTEAHDKIAEEEKAMERDMSTITEEMKDDILALLQLCGIPWVESPSEAEAQCAALEELGLVDGIVTEDSDVFVFGGKKVYKNFFDEKKFVEAYYARDIARDLALKKHQLVALAMLLGGDYSDGVKGVGIVNGMEILQAFTIGDSAQGIRDGLQRFREWLDGFGEPCLNDESFSEKELLFHRKHKSARTRWVAPGDFPSHPIINAYLRPAVNKSKAKFSWAKPNLNGLQQFCAETLGWEQEETDRVVNPVLKVIESGSKQTRIESYFMRYEDSVTFAKVQSKRLKAVLNDIQDSVSTNYSTDTRADADDVEAEAPEIGNDLKPEARRQK